MDIRRRSQIGGIKKTSSGGGSSEGPIIDNYLTIEALEDGLTASLSTNACKYCVDGDGNWKTLTAGTATESINTGHTLSFRGNLTPKSSNGIGTFTITKKCNLKGNCMSMLFGDNAANNFSLSDKSHAFYRLFQNCTNIVYVSSNFLPATTLSKNCYYEMFRSCTSLMTAPALPVITLAEQCYTNMFNGCTSLIIAPELPATTLSKNCYYSMFQGCTSLTTAPELPATTLTNYCYGSMFCNCTSLIIAPELPATTLAEGCYYQMFYGCSKLNYIKMLATDISASYCLYWWVRNTSSTGTFVKNPAMTTLPTSISGIPSGWTVVNDGEESEGGSNKIVNKITFKNLRGKMDLTADIYCDYIPTSIVDIVFTSVSGNYNQTFVSPTKYEGSAIIGAKMESPFTVDWTPREDDTYIYEVIIEQ